MSEYYSVLTDSEARKSLILYKKDLAVLASEVFTNLNPGSDEFATYPEDIQCLIYAYISYKDTKTSFEDNLKKVDTKTKQDTERIRNKITKFYNKLKSKKH